MLSSRSIRQCGCAHRALALFLALSPVFAHADDRPDPLERTGDINADGQTNGLDLQRFAVAIQQASDEPDELLAADFSDDGMIDIADIPGMIDAMLEASAQLEPLVAYWKLDEGGRPHIAHDAAGHHDGSLHGPSWTTEARFSGGLHFDGIDDYVEIGDLGLHDDWTVCFWVKPESASRPAYYPISLSSNQAGIIVAGASPSISQRIVLYDGELLLHGNTPSVLGQWYHIAITKEANTYTLYRDGVFDGSGELNDIDLDAFEFGRRHDGFGDFEGPLDDVAVWRCALPPGDIQDPEPGSINFFRLNSAAGPAPGQAYNPSPINYTTNARLCPTLRWHPVYSDHDCDDHRIYIDPCYEAVCQGLVSYVTTHEPVFEPDKLDPDTTYFWRVDEEQSSKTWCAGRVWRFTTGSIQATGPHPSKGACDVDLSPMLTWTGGADTAEIAGHVVYLSDNPCEVNLRSPAACLGTFDDPACQLPNMPRLTTYYWCVDEIDMAGRTQPGEAWSFTTRLAPSLPNADAYLITPTFEDSGQAIHPDVKYFPDGWNGYEYWMAMTPYPFSYAYSENPSILVSHDGTSWEVPPGLMNPLLLAPEGGYNADTDLVYNDDEDELWVYFLQCYEDASLVKLALMRSADGITWSEPEHLITWDITVADNERSYAIVKQGSDWHYWAEVRDAPGPVVYRHSTDGKTWSDPQPIICTSCPPGLLWHVDVIYVPSQEEYWMLFNIYSPGELFLARSTDRIHWTVDPRPVMSPREGSWDGLQLYRSTLWYDESEEVLRIWYSARNVDTEWHTGYSQGTYRMQE